jgi:hypothetical protein
MACHTFLGKLGCHDRNERALKEQSSEWMPSCHHQELPGSLEFVTGKLWFSGKDSGAARLRLRDGLATRAFMAAAARNLLAVGDL